MSGLGSYLKVNGCHGLKAQQTLELVPWLFQAGPQRHVASMAVLVGWHRGDKHHSSGGWTSVARGAQAHRRLLCLACRRHACSTRGRCVFLYPNLLSLQGHRS